jgi:hypothetical protein
MNKLSQNTVISHYNKLEGVDRILTELYGTALRAGQHNTYDPYSQKLLSAILAVATAQRELHWSPAPEGKEEVDAAPRTI